MTSTNVKTLLFFMACFLFGCSNNPNQSKHTEQQEANVKQDSLPQVESNTEPSSVALQDKPVSETFTLLQGKWQHTDDKTNYLVFEGNIRKEIAGGMKQWDEEPFVLSDKCENAMDKENGSTPEKDKYISCPKSNLCWYIIGVDKETLSLSYMGRGNTLNYKRVK